MDGADDGAPGWTPLIVLRNSPCARVSPTRVPDADGWYAKGSRRARQVHRPRRPVPKDLRGKCFNCFSPDHRAMDCRSQTRCFRCRGLGHRAFDCRRRLEVARLCDPQPRSLEWRPKISLAAGVAAPPADMAPTNAAPGAPQGRKRRRRRSRKKKGKGIDRQDSGDDADDSSAPVPSSDDDRALGLAAAPRPRRILDRSADLVRKEEDLSSRALVVTVVSGCPELTVCSFAKRFEIEVSSLSLRRFGDARFLLILPNAELAERVYNGGRPFITSELRVHVMRWSRLLNSTASSLPSPVEVDIRGIPAHAWDFSTAELLLCDHGWIGSAHPDTADHRDVFKVVAWCATPESIPLKMELEIVEPPVVSSDPRPQKRSLVYPISLSLSPVELPPMSGNPPPPPPADDGDQRQDRRRQEPPPTAGSARGVRRPPVHQRLGPLAEAGGRVAQQDSAACAALGSVRDIQDGVASSSPDVTLGMKMAPLVHVIPAAVEDFGSATSQAGEDLGDVSPQVAIPWCEEPPAPLSQACHEAAVVYDAESPQETADGDIEEAWRALPVADECHAVLSPEEDVRLDAGPPFQDEAQNVLGAPCDVGPSQVVCPSPSAGPFAACEDVALDCQGSPPLPSPAAISGRRRHPLPPTLKTYARRDKIPTTLENLRVAEPSIDTPLLERIQDQQIRSPAADFISKLSKTPGGMLPFPAINKRRKKTRPSPGVVVRRSRRAAKLPPLGAEECLPHLKKKVMRALDMDVPEEQPERVQFDQEILEEYARRFRHPHATQVQAVAALFGLIPPEGVESDGCVA